jgi:hypothetical protein
MKSWQLAKRHLAKGYSFLNSPNPKKPSPPALSLEKRRGGSGGSVGDKSRLIIIVFVEYEMLPCRGLRIVAE